MRLLKFSQGLGRSLIQFLKTKLVLDHFPVFLMKKSLLLKILIHPYHEFIKKLSIN